MSERAKDIIIGISGLIILGLLLFLALLVMARSNPRFEAQVLMRSLVGPTVVLIKDKETSKDYILDRKAFGNGVTYVGQNTD